MIRFVFVGVFLFRLMQKLSGYSRSGPFVLGVSDEIRIKSRGDRFDGRGRSLVGRLKGDD
jgi:phosphotransacetylase